jgi:hypothetical protein
MLSFEISVAQKVCFRTRVDGDVIEMLTACAVNALIVYALSDNQSNQNPKKVRVKVIRHQKHDTIK